MKKKIGLIVLILTLIGMIAVVGCTPITPEKFSGKELGIKVDGDVVKIEIIVYESLYTPARNVENYIEVGDERFDGVRKLTERILRDIELEKLSQKPEGGLGGLRLRYPNGDMLDLYFVISSKSEMSFLIDEIWYLSDVSFKEFNEIYEYILHYGSEATISESIEQLL